MGYRLVEHFEQNREEGPRYRVVMREWTPDWAKSEHPQACIPVHPHTHCTQKHRWKCTVFFALQTVMLPALDAAVLAAAFLDMGMSRYRHVPGNVRDVRPLQVLAVNSKACSGF
jgi:hypothetical protein